MPSLGATIYLCKAYIGERTFWSSLPCSQQQAAAQASYQVPDGLPLAEQAAIAARQHQQAQRTQQPSPSLHGIQSGPVPGSEKECEALKERIKDLEQMRHRVNPPLSLDAIAGSLRFHRERVSALRCR